MSSRQHPWAWARQVRLFLLTPSTIPSQFLKGGWPINLVEMLYKFNTL